MDRTIGKGQQLRQNSKFSELNCVFVRFMMGGNKAGAELLKTPKMNENNEKEQFIEQFKTC
jgi:hypothetical protein